MDRLSHFFHTKTCLRSVTEKQLKTFPFSKNKHMSLKSHDYDNLNYTCHFDTVLVTTFRFLFFFFTQMPSHEYVGELLLSLNYFPTTQRLTIVILKARNLKIESTSGLWGEFSISIHKNSRARERARARASPTGEHEQARNPEY